MARIGDITIVCNGRHSAEVPIVAKLEGEGGEEPLTLSSLMVTDLAIRVPGGQIRCPPDSISIQTGHPTSSSK